MKSLIYSSLLGLTMLTACHPNDSITPQVPEHSAERQKPESKSCQLTDHTWSGTVQRFKFSYDTEGRLTGYGATGATPRFNYGSSYVYDTKGFLVKETFVLNPFLDAYTTTNTFEYDAKGKLLPRASLNQTLVRDAAGRVVKLTKRYSDTSVAYVISYSYNVLGRLVEQAVTYTNGRRMSWKWDKLGENVIRMEQGTSQGISSVVEYTYDRKPNPLNTLFTFKGWDVTDYLNLKGWHPFDTYEDFGGNYGGVYQAIPRFSQNNPLKEVSTSVGGVVITSTYSYEYNDSGYPTTTRIRRETTNGPTTTETRQLAYQNCQQRD